MIVHDQIAPNRTAPMATALAGNASAGAAIAEIDPSRINLAGNGLGRTNPVTIAPSRTGHEASAPIKTDRAMTVPTRTDQGATAPSRTDLAGTGRARTAHGQRIVRMDNGRIAATIKSGLQQSPWIRQPWKHGAWKLLHCLQILSATWAWKPR